MFGARTLAKRLSSCPRVQLRGPWARAVDPALLRGPPPGAPANSRPQPLWPHGPSVRGARFTPRGGPPSVYLAPDPQTALIEVGAIFETSETTRLVARKPWLLLIVEGIVDDAIDLTDPQVQKLLGTNISELTGSWLFAASHGRHAPTQVLGAQASKAGIAGLRYLSAKPPNKTANVVVFPENLRSPSFIETVDPTGQYSQRLP